MNKRKDGYIINCECSKDGKWFCHHCNIGPLNKKAAWSRKGHHWCSDICMNQDLMSQAFKEIKMNKRVEDENNI